MRVYVIYSGFVVRGWTVPTTGGSWPDKDSVGFLDLETARGWIKMLEPAAILSSVFDPNETIVEVWSTEAASNFLTFDGGRAKIEVNYEMFSM